MILGDSDTYIPTEGMKEDFPPLRTHTTLHCKNKLVHERHYKCTDPCGIAMVAWQCHRDFTVFNLKTLDSSNCFLPLPPPPLWKKNALIKLVDWSAGYDKFSFG